MTRRSLARFTLLAATTAVFAVPAQAGAVVDIQPSAAITANLGGKAKECGQTECSYRGGRKLTVDWTANCNVTAPQVNRTVDVSMLARPKVAGGKPVAFDSLEIESEAPNGTGVLVVPAGTRVFVRVTVQCSYTTTDAEGNDTAHTGEAAATTADFFLPPALEDYAIPRSGSCGLNVPSRLLGRVVQAGGYADLFYILRFSAFSMLGKNTVATHASGVRLYGKGGGMNFKVKPDRRALRGGEYKTYLSPKRGGTLKIWATIGGVKTNVLKIKVFPKRC